MDKILQKMLYDSELTPDDVPELLKCDLKVKFNSVNCELNKIRILYSQNNSIVLGNVKSDKMRIYLFNLFLHVFISKGFALTKYSEFDPTKIFFTKQFTHIYVNNNYIDMRDPVLGSNSDAILMAVKEHLYDEISICDFLINTFPSKLFYKDKEYIIVDLFSKIISNDKKVSMMIYMLTYILEHDTYVNCKNSIIFENLTVPNALYEIIKFFITVSNFEEVSTILNIEKRVTLSHDQYQNLHQLLNTLIINGNFPTFGFGNYTVIQQVHNILFRYESIDTIHKDNS